MADGTAALPFELAALAGATRYQEWLFSVVSDHLGDSVLEVGAGVGTMTKWITQRVERVVATDVSPALLTHLESAAAHWDTRPEVIRIWDPTEGMDGERPGWATGLDTVVSFNVLEHIPDDVAAVRGMAEAVAGPSGAHPGRVIVFVPAHQWAYGALDEAFDHYRRYSKASLRSVIRRAGLGDASVRMSYFNTGGLPGWFLWGRVLGRDRIPEGSIRTMEIAIPVLRSVDRFLHRGSWDLPLGQSLLCTIELR